MKLLLDIGHPAHIHYYRNLAKHFISKGGKVLFVARNKEVTFELLKKYDFDFIPIGKPYTSKAGKLFGLLIFSVKFLYIAIKFNPDYILNGSPYAALAAFMLRKPLFALEDSFNMEQVKLFLPFSSAVFTGTYPHPSLGKREIRFDGYQELAYLHSKYYTPDPAVLDVLGIHRNKKFALIRFVSWKASHDFGQKGLNDSKKIELVEQLSKYCDVYISSEGVLPDQLKKYHISIAPDKMHDVLYFASLYVGEGATMASEAGILGTPSIYVNSIERGYTTELEKQYGIVFNFRNAEGVIEKAIEIITSGGSETKQKKIRSQILSDKINVTDMLIWFIEHYPDSFSIIKNTPGYLNRFKNSNIGENDPVFPSL